MNLRKQRNDLGLDQKEFWGRIGISQSGGSRYENENRKPGKPVIMLLIIAYGSPRDRAKTLESIIK